jgi:4-amino-4-deoxy-L-arabinose transferase-like glycosyltransferase
VFLIPEISQTFLRTRTHNLLVTALVPLACLAFLDLVERGRRRDYALFGLASGVAILAKATGAIFLVALVLAALSQRSLRRAILAPGMMLTLALGVLVLAGPTLWALANPDLSTASLAKFEPGGGRLEGLAGLAWGVVASAGFLAASVGIAALLTRRGAADPMEAEVFWRAGAISILLIAGAIIVTDSAELKERWLVPVVAPLAPLALVWVMRRRGWMRYFPAALGGFVALAMLAALPGYFRKTEPPPGADFAVLAEAFRATGATSMLMRDDMAAGVALVAPDLPVAQRVDHGALPCAGTVLLAVWPGQDMALDRFRARLPGCTAEETVAQVIDAGGTAIEIRVFRLTPAA